MLTRRALITLSLIAALVGCASIGTRETSLAGRWYGEDFQPYLGGSAKWLMDRKPDGTYSVVFRRYKDNQVIGEQRERGRWAFSNGMYTTLTQFMGDEPTDPKDKHFHDIYFVESFDGDEMTYKHVETGLMFKSKRVSDGFQLP